MPSGSRDTCSFIIYAIRVFVNKEKRVICVARTSFPFSSDNKDRPIVQ